MTNRAKLEKVLEVFDGYVMDENTIQLISRTNGDELIGEYTDKIKIKNIKVDDSFVCTTVGVIIDGVEYTRLDIEKIEDRKITDDEAREISDKINRLFDDRYDNQVNY